jgi:hypothetical protein
MKFKHLSFYFFCIFLFNCGRPKKNASASEDSKSGFYNIQDFKKVDKIDAHVHIETDRPDFIQQASDDNFRLLTINWDDPNESADMAVQQNFAVLQMNKCPKYLAYATTFSLKDFNNVDWKERTISYLKKSFAQGAIAIKIYKVIGMGT